MLCVYRDFLWLGAIVSRGIALRLCAQYLRHAPLAPLAATTPWRVLTRGKTKLCDLREPRPSTKVRHVARTFAKHLQLAFATVAQRRGKIRGFGAVDGDLYAWCRAGQFA